MEKSVLRIYLPISAKVKAKRSFWQKVFGPSLGGFLLIKAKEFGIEQTLLPKSSWRILKGSEVGFRAS